MIRRLLLALALLAPGGAWAQVESQGVPRQSSEPSRAVLVEPGALRLRPGGGRENLLADLKAAPGETACADAPPRPFVTSEDDPDPPDWGCAVLTNAGDRPGVWRLFDPSGSGIGGMEAYVLREGAGDLDAVLRSPLPFSSYAGRSAQLRVFASEPIALAPGETVTLEVQPLYVGIQSVRHLMLMPEAAFDARVLREETRFAIYFGICTILLVYFVAYGLLLRSRPALWYALFFGLFLATRLTYNGYAAWWLFPAYPELGLLGGVLTYAGASVAYLAFAVSFVRASGAALSARLAWIAGGLFAAIGAGSLLVPLLGLPEATEPMFLATMALPVLVAGVGAIYGLRAMRRGAEGARLFTLGAVVLMVYLGLVISTFGSPDMARRDLFAGVGQIADGLIFAAALIRQSLALREQRDAALGAELEATRQAARANAQLLAARDDVDEARALAARHRARLATTGHDLRQPLQSLGLALEEARREAPELGERLEASLGYLGDVLDRAVEEGRPGEEAEAEAEAIPLDVVLGNAVRMFASEAAAKGLTLRAAPTSLATTADPVALIRMTANLTANAIRYTEGGGVLLGARRRGGALAIEVWDTGPGLTEAQVEALRQPYARGDTGEGEGLGLASVEEMAAAQGARLAVRSRPGRGSVFAVEGLPLA